MYPSPSPAPPVGNITSVQPLSIVIGSSAASNTGSLTTVDATRTVIFPSGFNSSNSSGTAAADYGRITLTDANTVTATRNSNQLPTTLSCSITAVEFTSNVVESVQYGTISLTGTSANTATITAVDTSRSIVIWLGSSGDDAAGRTGNAFLVLTNGTTVTGQSGDSSGTNIVSFCVVQFKASVIQSIQATTTGATTATSVNTAISAVTTANSLVIINGWSAASGNLNNQYCRLQLTTTTNVSMTRLGTSSATFYFTVLEFAAGVLNSLQRNTIVIGNTAAANTSTITAVNTAKSFMNFTGVAMNQTTDPSSGFETCVLTNATTVTMTRTGTSFAQTGSYEAVEFV